MIAGLWQNDGCQPGMLWCIWCLVFRTCNTLLHREGVSCIPCESDMNAGIQAVLCLVGFNMRRLHCVSAPRLALSAPFMTQTPVFVLMLVLSAFAFQTPESFVGSQSLVPRSRQALSIGHAHIRQVHPPETHQPFWNRQMPFQPPVPALATTFEAPVHGTVIR